MALQIVLNGARELCNQMTTELYASCHLYVNALLPTRNTLLTDFTEASYPGYAPQEIYGWAPAVIQGNNAVSWSDQLVFTRGNGGALQLVYGYFVTRGNPRRLLWAELRPFGPIRMEFGGDVVVVLPQLTVFT